MLRPLKIIKKCLYTITHSVGSRMKTREWSNFIGIVCRTKTMHQLLCFKSKFLPTLCSHLDVTSSCYFWSSLLNMDNESLHTLDN